GRRRGAGLGGRFWSARAPPGGGGAFPGRGGLCPLGESLGGVETLISHPATMTHASIPEEERNRLGVTPGLVRISVGIEDIEDITADLDRALAAIPQPVTASR